MSNTKKKPIWSRDREGNVTRFESSVEAAAFFGTSTQAVNSAIYKGRIFRDKWQLTRCEGDWTACDDFPETASEKNDEAQNKKESETDRLFEIEKRLSEIRKEMEKHLDEPVEKINEPKTKEDWEEMRKRALQPFKPILTDEYLRLKQEKHIKEAMLGAKAMSKESIAKKHDMGGIEEAALSYSYMNTK